MDLGGISFQTKLTYGMICYFIVSIILKEVLIVSN